MESTSSRITSRQTTFSGHARFRAHEKKQDDGAAGSYFPSGLTRFARCRDPYVPEVKTSSAAGKDSDTTLLYSCGESQISVTSSMNNIVERPKGSPLSPYEREKAIVDETVDELECLLDLAEHCQQAAVDLKLQQLLLMRERNAYLEKLRQVENFCENMRCEGDKQDQRLSRVLRQILYSEKATPL